MNYLAHIYLSGVDEKIIVGNFIGDYIKGNKYNKFPVEIQHGILLHRYIDSYTDSHKKIRESKKVFNELYGLYSGIVIDFFYDHFLARNWQKFSDENLRSFAKRTHAILLSHFLYLPKKVQSFLPFLIQNRRLESYATFEGIQKSLEIMSRYTSLPENSIMAVEIMKSNFHYLENNFFTFMNDIMNFIEYKFQIELVKPGVPRL